MDPLDALLRSKETFTATLREVAPDDWERATPCPAWDVRALLNHVIGGNVRYTMLIRGGAAEALAPTRTMDHVGENPRASFSQTFKIMYGAFAAPGALGVITHHPSGDRSGRELLAMRVMEQAVHGWDLARAIGADETIDADVAQFLLSVDELISNGQRDGFYSAVDEIPTGLTDQDRLLYLVGRKVRP